MVDISQDTNIQSTGAVSGTIGFLRGALKSIDKVLISEGAAKARIRKVEMLSAKSDEELAKMGLCREDIIRVVFCDYTDV